MGVAAGSFDCTIFDGSTEMVEPLGAFVTFRTPDNHSFRARWTLRSMRRAMSAERAGSLLAPCLKYSVPAANAVFDCPCSLVYAPGFSNIMGGSASPTVINATFRLLR